MPFSEIYNHLLPLWGATLAFADGALLQHKNPFLALGKLKGMQNTSAGTVHFYSEEFSNRWQSAEKQLPETNVLARQVMWAMYQVFHARATALFSQQVFSFSPASISMEEVEAQLLKNLSEPGYEEELALYRNLGS